MIVVRTPTGNIGRHVVQHLIDAGEAVRVVVRDPARSPDAVRDRVEVVVGSHGDAAVADQAFRGAEAVFWLCPPTPSATPEAQTIEFARPAAAAIARRRVPRIVAATTLGRGTAWQDRAGMATASIRMVDVLRDTGAAVRGLALPAVSPIGDPTRLRATPAPRSGPTRPVGHPDPGGGRANTSFESHGRGGQYRLVRGDRPSDRRRRHRVFQESRP